MNWARWVILDFKVAGYHGKKVLTALQWDIRLKVSRIDHSVCNGTVAVMVAFLHILRKNECQWFQPTVREIPFLRHVLITVEKKFTLITCRDVIGKGGATISCDYWRKPVANQLISGWWQQCDFLLRNFKCWSGCFLCNRIEANHCWVVKSQGLFRAVFCQADGHLGAYCHDSLAG